MKTLLIQAITAAQKAGNEIMRLYEVADFETKEDGSPVTVADLRAHTVITETLTETGIPILSEESEGTSLPYPDRIWVIDPLDGTKDFIKKTKDFSVMIGLLEQGRPTLGVVYAPARDILYYATRGEGAYSVHKDQTTRLLVPQEPQRPLRFVCSVNNFTPFMDSVASKLNARKTPRGSIGIKASVVSEGHGEFFFSQGNLGEWDVCAPEIILLEAGGRVTDTEGNLLHYGNEGHRLTHGILFSQTACYAEVFDAIQSAHH